MPQSHAKYLKLMLHFNLDSAELLATMVDICFDSQKPLSYFTIGNQDASFRIVILHGVGSNAEHCREGAEELLAHFPKASITLMNGGEKIQENILREQTHDRFLQSPSLFSWYGKSFGRGGHKPVADIIREFNVDPRRVVVFGFSQGGFMAADIVHNHPDVARYAFLHSSGLIGSYNHFAARSPSPCTYDTMLSLDDPFLRTPMVLSIFKHYQASYLLRKNGHKTCTHWSNGFGHGVTKKSIASAAAIIRNRLTL